MKTLITQEAKKRITAEEREVLVNVVKSLLNNKDNLESQLVTLQDRIKEIEETISKIEKRDSSTLKAILYPKPVNEYTFNNVTANIASDLLSIGNTYKGLGTYL